MTGRVVEEGGDTPPYHYPVSVLTHHPRQPLGIDGGTVFQFVTNGFESALAQAKEAAQGKDVRIGAASRPSGRACGRG